MNIFLIILRKIHNKLTFRTLEIAFVIHETENIDILTLNLNAIFGLVDSDYKIKKTEGHHGNMIKFVQVYLVRNRVQDVIDKILSLLAVVDKEDIIQNIESYLDSRFTFFLRVSKQEIPNKKLVLSYDDSIRIKMKPSMKLSQSNAHKFYIDVLEDSL